MKDRELIELAAKAAGIDYVPEKSMPHPKSGAFWGLWLLFDGEPSQYARRYFNPLTDDGDALRLAAKLYITIAHPNPADLGGGYITASFHKHQYRYLFPKMTSFIEEFGDNPLPAIRRSIVRAAAQIQIEKEAK